MYQFKGREWYREYHESEYDPVIEPSFEGTEDEDDEEEELTEDY
jgi:hypothetical protein